MKRGGDLGGNEADVLELGGVVLVRGRRGDKARAGVDRITEGELELRQAGNGTRESRGNMTVAVKRRRQNRDFDRMRLKTAV